MKLGYRTLVVAVAGLVCAVAGAHAQAAPGTGTAVVLENESFRYEIAPDGRNAAFIDKASGTNYVNGAEPGCAGSVKLSLIPI